MPAANGFIATTTGLLAARAKQQIYAAWLQPGSRSMQRMADSIVDELLQALTTLHDLRLAQICGLPPEGAPLLDQAQPVLTSLLPLATERAHTEPERAADPAAK